MFPILIRGLIIYIVIVASVRIMGKRQIGELQPSELVVTILLSQIASMPLEDSEVPLLQCLFSVFLLVSFEIIFSVITVKSIKFRHLVEGKSVAVISEGKILQKNLKLLRLTVDDLIESLRLKDVFDLSQVDYAFIETNGTMSVKLKAQYSPATVGDLKEKPPKEYIDCLIISDGKILESEMEKCGLGKEKLKNILKKKNLKPKDIFLMTYSKDQKNNIVLKEKKKK
ncbi:MAG: DUF421 domain-containing protein [Clostridia bacterium]|nr:DUF421 domain-containing protein [Clostridia bacterium]